MSLELTENKSNIGSAALNDLVFILHCRVIGRWLPTRRRSVGYVCFDCRKSATLWRSVRQPIGDWLAISRRLKTVSGLSTTAATGRWLVGNLSATNKNCSTIDLIAERFHLQQPKPPCDQIVPATFCNRSTTCRRPPCNRPATSLRPTEILVARRSQTGCKLCVTGALWSTLSARQFLRCKTHHSWRQRWHEKRPLLQVTKAIRQNRQKIVLLQ